MTRVLRLSVVPVHLASGGGTGCRGAGGCGRRSACRRRRRNLLKQAKARDRVRALTQTIRAYEDGLAAMRERPASGCDARGATVRAVWRPATRKSQTLLGVLAKHRVAGAPVALLHPAGPMGTARSGMMLADITPALNAEARRLRAGSRRGAGAARPCKRTLPHACSWACKVQQARTALNRRLPTAPNCRSRFTEDPVRTAILIASTETLDGFASGLSRIGRRMKPMRPICH